MVSAPSKEPPKERWALVIGGSGALGAGICEALAAEGWNVGLTYRANRDRAKEVADRIGSLGRKCDILSLDLGDTEGIGDALNPFLVNVELGAVIYAAGPFVPQQYVSEVAWKDLQEVLRQDVVGAFAVLSASIRHLRDARGVIVALTTTAVGRYAKRDILSAAPKAALQAVVRGIAVEEARFGVRANCVAVGMIEDGLYNQLVESGDLPAEALQAIRDSIPLPRLGKPDDVAQAVAYLASPRAAWVTGETLYVDGGRTI